MKPRFSKDCSRAASYYDHKQYLKNRKRKASMLAHLRREFIDSACSFADMHSQACGDVQLK
jgi:hypothetical protein